MNPAPTGSALAPAVVGRYRDRGRIHPCHCDDYGLDLSGLWTGHRDDASRFPVSIIGVHAGTCSTTE